MERICKQCNITFKAERKEREYCSKKCQHISMKGQKLSIETRRKMSKTRSGRIVIPLNRVPCLYYLCELSIVKIAKIINVKHQTLYNRMKRHGMILRMQEVSMKKGKESPHWKGGKYTDSCGYIRHGSGKHKGMLDHRLIAGEVLGRSLKQSEVVHHINENRSDNKNRNLLICTRSYHTWLHRRIDIKNNKPLFGRKICQA